MRSRLARSGERAAKKKKKRVAERMTESQETMAWDVRILMRKVWTRSNVGNGNGIGSFDACDEETMLAPGGLNPPLPPLLLEEVVVVVVVGQGEWEFAVGS